MITPATFGFRNRFSEELTDSLIEEAIEIVYSDWSGVSSLWQGITTRDAKIETCYSYLVGWWLADTYPALVNGVFVTGGVPLQRKNIGGVDLTFKALDVQGQLEQLTTNYFGLKALSMLQSVPEKYRLY